jgi:hypothetical protein
MHRPFECSHEFYQLPAIFPTRKIIKETVADIPKMNRRNGRSHSDVNELIDAFSGC